MRKAAGAISLLVVILATVALLGPRPDTRVTPKVFEVEDPADYISDTEHGIGDIVHGAEKKIIWHGAAGEKTDLALVYVHGFSATRQETAPLCDSVAARLGANLFYTRLAGHGRGDEAMAGATASDWFNDVSEAVAVGRALGDRVILIGNSTGSTLAVWWLGSQDTPKELKASVVAAVLMSPNFAPADPDAKFLAWPWGGQLARLIVGPEYAWEPDNEMQARYWTTRYPTEALVTMTAAVEAADAVDPSQIAIPTIVIYSAGDTVVDTRRIPGWFSHLGSGKKKMVEVGDVSDPSNHVLAGAIMSPGSTERLAEQIVAFLRESVD